MGAKRNTALIQDAILQSIYQNAGRVQASALAQQFDVSPQSIYTNLKKLIDRRVIEPMELPGRQKRYTLAETTVLDESFKTQGLNEDAVFHKYLRSMADALSPIARQAFSYVFMEMLNNAIEHSESEDVHVLVTESAYDVSCVIADDGVGIFSKIQRVLGLEEKKYALLELAKGKFTTEPESHTGEGIFFSSKIADSFVILSDGLAFVGSDVQHELPPFLLDLPGTSGKGTSVLFSIRKNRTRTMQMVFAEYTEHPDDYGFNKTVVPVRLLEYGEQNPIFISRSQARRLIARFERFKNVILDYTGIDEIGQGFADEVYRVFQNAHPDCVLINTNANEAVRQMIRHVKRSPDETES